jgi:hypothetical protein
MNEGRNIQTDLNEGKRMMIHTDMKIVDQKVTERAISEISDHHFSIFH